MREEHNKYLELLSEKYPTVQSAYREIINLSAILNLPKGTEHFMSDLHGEYEAFYHILNNCSGVISEKVKLLFQDSLSDEEQKEICTLIYYPGEKLDMLKREKKLSDEWYRKTLNQLVEITKMLSSKYTRSKVRKAMPEEFAYIIDELLHVQKDEDNNQVVYHKKILDMILELKNADEFIIALSALMKRLAVDHLHIVGDIYDRGPFADRILDLLMKYHSLDIQWGNHDILWMGAASGSEACIAGVVRNCLKYHNVEMLESGYGISLRNLTLFAEKTYQNLEPMEAALKAISIILFKIEGNIIRRHPEFEMKDRLLLDEIDISAGTVKINKKIYFMKDREFPTLVGDDPCQLTSDEHEIMDKLKTAFKNSVRLQKHMDFLYEKGSMYLVYNGNLMFHGCIPLDKNGKLEQITIDGIKYQGKRYLDYAEKIVRKLRTVNAEEKDRDFIWYLWCGKKSPLSGRNVKTFERTFLKEIELWEEEKNPYYQYHTKEEICTMILKEFGLDSPISHIINGHTPVKTLEGEEPIKANGKLMVIDGGFCREYHKMTGIAGYTLIFNSHGLRLKAHQPFESIQQALSANMDIESDSKMIETEKSRVMVKDTDVGKKIEDDILGLKELVKKYRKIY